MEGGEIGSFAGISLARILGGEYVILQIRQPRQALHSLLVALFLANGCFDGGAQDAYDDGGG